MNEHNYRTKINALLASGELKPGSVNVVADLHDDWCALLVRGDCCDCDPLIVVREIVPGHDQ